jgi:hypothetical protein
MIAGLVLKQQKGLGLVIAESQFGPMSTQARLHCRLSLVCNA